MPSSVRSGPSFTPAWTKSPARYESPRGQYNDRLLSCSNGDTEDVYQLTANPAVSTFLLPDVLWAVCPFPPDSPLNWRAMAFGMSFGARGASLLLLVTAALALRSHINQRRRNPAGLPYPPGPRVRSLPTRIAQAVKLHLGISNHRQPPRHSLSFLV